MDPAPQDSVVPDPRQGDWRRLKASVRGALFGPAPGPTKIGRFTVLRTLGSGGMGIVYSAYDDELERKVAIKLLDAERDEGSEGRARLLREAQAMARLSHPNVIAVYEVGTHEGDVFIAMEYVRGQNLRSWLAEEPRPVRQILDAFAQAGAGLSAAHAGGLVHRDFKPDNVLMGRDGRVRVVDFGLARPSPGNPPADDADLTVTEQLPGGLLDSPLTRDGTVVGTPAYMAPEQHAGEATDARSDQFSFCVALYEALYGERPYDGETLHELALAVARGRRRPEPPGSRVPAWIRDIILRGLSPDPADRFRDMGALLAALRRDPAVKRRRMWVAAAGVVAIAGSLGGGVLLGGGGKAARVATCKPAAERLAGAWDDKRREALGRAVTTSGVRDRDRVWERLQSRLDSYTTDWTRTYELVCDAPASLGPTELASLERRRACLDWRRDDLERAVGLLLSADSDTLAAGSDLVRMLPPPALCADLRNVDALVPPPPGPAGRQEATAILAGLARAKVATREEQMGEARAEARAAVERARALENRALEARGLLVLQMVQHHMGDNSDAASTVIEAALAAETAGADRLYVFTALAAVEALTMGEFRLSEAEQWMKRAEAMRAELGPDPELDHELAYVKGTFALMRDDMESSVEHLQAALDLGEKLYGRDSAELLRTLNNFAVALRGDTDMPRAARLLERQRRIVEAEFGKDSVHTAFALMNLGSTRMMLGEVEDALLMGQEAVTIMDRVADETNPRRALAHMVYGHSLERADRIPEALGEYELAVQSADRAGFDIQAVRSYFSLQRVLHDLGRYEEALAVGRRAAGIFEQQFSGQELARDRQYAHLLAMMALEAVLGGDPEEGRALATRSINLYEQHEATGAALSFPRYALALALEASGQAVGDLREQIRAAGPDTYKEDKMLPTGERMKSAMDRWLAGEG